eukprot:228535_1
MSYHNTCSCISQSYPCRCFDNEDDEKKSNSQAPPPPPVPRHNNYVLARYLAICSGFVGLMFSLGRYQHLFGVNYSDTGGGLIDENGQEWLSLGDLEIQFD